MLMMPGLLAMIMSKTEEVTIVGRNHQIDSMAVVVGGGVVKEEEKRQLQSAEMGCCCSVVGVDERNR